jgi:hypothetical protein
LPSQLIVVSLTLHFIPFGALEKNKASLAFVPLNLILQVSNISSSGLQFIKCQLLFKAKSQLVNLIVFSGN